MFFGKAFFVDFHPYYKYNIIIHKNKRRGSKKHLMRKKVLILGGEGFIGRNIAQEIEDDFDVFSASIEETVFKNNRKDIFLKTNPYSEKIENDFQVIIHLIDNAQNLESFEKEEKKLTQNLSINEKNHLIIFSSAVIYSNPQSDYGKRKLILENFYKSFSEENNIRLTILRLFNTFGPFQMPMRQGSLISNIFYNYLKNRATEINDPESKRDFIYSKDVAKIVRNVIEKNRLGSFDLSSNKLSSIGSMIKKIEEIMGEKIKIDNKKNKEKILSPPGKSPLLKNIELTPFSQSLKETYEFYEKNLNLIEKV